jgi:hypothetical protein
MIAVVLCYLLAAFGFYFVRVFCWCGFALITSFGGAAFPSGLLFAI